MAVNYPFDFWDPNYPHPYDPSVFYSPIQEPPMVSYPQKSSPKIPF